MFQDKVCVVTGGALGIGRCLTREFSRAGAKTAFVDKNEPAGKENEEYIRKHGGQVLFFPGDISVEQVLRRFVEMVVKEYGKVDFLINNACFSMGGIMTPCSYEDFNRVLQVGVTAPYMLTRLFFTIFQPRRIGYQYQLQPGFYVPGEYRKLYGSKRRYYGSYPCSGGKPVRAGSGELHCPRLD